MTGITDKICFFLNIFVTNSVPFPFNIILTGVESGRYDGLIFYAKVTMLTRSVKIHNYFLSNW